MYDLISLSKKKKILGLAPMDGVTDMPFRLITKKYGNPDIMYTEFVAVEALIRKVPRALLDLRYKNKERPIIAQLYGNDPELFFNCAKIILELGFDGVDINMGCPAKSVVSRGCGAALINDPELCIEIISAVKKAVKEEILVSVKTRVGYNNTSSLKFFEKLLKQKLDFLAIHARTLKQGFKGDNNYLFVKKVKELQESINHNTLIFVNGNIVDKNSYQKAIKISNADGVLIGRGAWGNPWVFQEVVQKKQIDQKNFISLKKRFDVMYEHSLLMEKYFSLKEFVKMRGHLAKYIYSIPNAANLRKKLVKVNNSNMVKQILHDFLKTFHS